ncbi:MAG: small multi-drug export protein [Gammaproteobacteria bacterium]|nr:small multi-drug export protein [Gammaproteobacteria bacterium]NIR61453.1 small multi-drug export protein [Gammaproteobacteria bacterium]NIR91288.1 small multi-drug export protein [Gammaproteobacteria bacterium]
MSWGKRALFTAAPLALLLFAALAAALALPREQLAALYGLALLIFPGGRFVTLLPVAGDGLAFSPLFIAGMVAFIEFCFALFVSINLDLLYRLPRIGEGLRAMEREDEATLAHHPWIRRTTLLGVTLFLSLPLPAIGVVAGTVIARLAGLGVVRSFFAVVAGNLLGAYALALTAETFIAWMPIEQGGGFFLALRLGVLATLIVALSWVAQRWARAPATR